MKTNTQKMASTHAVHCVGVTKIGYKKTTEGVVYVIIRIESMPKKRALHTNSLAKERILFVVQCAIHWSIDHKRMCFERNASGTYEYMITGNKSLFCIIQTCILTYIIPVKSFSQDYDLASHTNNVC